MENLTTQSMNELLTEVSERERELRKMFLLSLKNPSLRSQIIENDSGTTFTDTLGVMKTKGWITPIVLGQIVTGKTIQNIRRWFPNDEKTVIPNQKTREQVYNALIQHMENSC